MTDIEEALRHAQPAEPSSDYFERGLARIDEFDGAPNLVSHRWRYATIGLALLFAASLALNIAGWVEEDRDPPAEVMLVHSELRQEGDLIVRETRYEHPGAREVTHE